MVKHLLFFFIIFLKFKNIINEINPLSYDLYVNSQLNNEVGKKGSIIFRLDDQLFSNDMNRTVIFTKTISNDKNTKYEIGCGLWLNDRESYIFCEFDETFPKGQYFFQFNDKFNYSGYEINLFSYEIYNITKLESDLIDLYSETQTINVTDDKDIYELKFKIISYNQEKIFIRNIYH